MMMTAAGTVAAAKIFVMGVSGVLGLITSRIIIANFGVGFNHIDVNAAFGSAHVHRVESLHFLEGESVPGLRLLLGLRERKHQAGEQRESEPAGDVVFHVCLC